MAEANEIVNTRHARFSKAAELFDDLEKTPASKRAPLPRAADYTKSFIKDWERLSRSGRYDLNKLKKSHVAAYCQRRPTRSRKAGLSPQ